METKNARPEYLMTTPTSRLIARLRLWNNVGTQSRNELFLRVSYNRYRNRYFSDPRIDNPLV